ncbi:hypothetical protein [Spongiactinospora sp. TRM90649]|uniref:hypothetical protein n=1 Tax=Spongiactinospora sp. TRM90649 TaxID=3031114 RepID=UPI0023F6DF1B|nr:hypothetical protein [Spongiactinospora sp. TRM90649]MDF5751624.1 hypothetical protein [Spongiactinospora sp. TRM90649]
MNEMTTNGNRTAAAITGLMFVVASGAAPASAMTGNASSLRGTFDPASASATASALPPALPATGAGPVTFGYLCFDKKTYEPTGVCAQWRLVAADGRLYRLPDALGFEVKKGKPPETGMPGKLAISPDGTRIAYHRASDDRVVVRDLETGKIWPIDHSIARGSLGSPFQLAFVRDGRQLAISDEGTDGNRKDVTLARIDEETVRRLPYREAVLDSDPESGKLTLLSEPGLGRRGHLTVVEGDRKRRVKIPEKAGKHLIWGPFAARDDRAANLVPKDAPACGPDMTPVWLTVFDTGSGRMTKIRPSLPKDVYRGDVIDWLNRDEVVVAAGRERPGKAANSPIGAYVYAMNVKSGKSRLIRKFTVPGKVYQDTLAVGGYAEVTGNLSAGKVNKPKKRGCE